MQNKIPNIKQIKSLVSNNNMFRVNQLSFISQANLPENSICIFKGGQQQNFYNSDTELKFRQEQYFNYLFGVIEPDLYASIYVPPAQQSGLKVILFVPKWDNNLSVWMQSRDLEYFNAKYLTKHVDNIMLIDELENYVTQLKPSKIYINGGIHPYSKQANLTPSFPWLAQFSLDSTTINPSLQESRITKSQYEVQLIQTAIEVTSQALKSVLKASKTAQYEFELEQVFINEGAKLGYQLFGFGTIVGSGPNSAVLHYIDNDAEIKEDQLIVFDCGYEIYGYTADITMTFPSRGKFTQQQKDIYNIVLSTNLEIQSLVKPGINWKDLHLLSIRRITEGLQNLNIIKKEFTIEELIEKRIGNRFMPHGLGHYLGIDVHDVGIYLPEHSFPGVRIARILKPGNIVTVEPGIYFSKFLLDLVKQEEVGKYINQEVFQQYENVGGVRIEDDVLVTEEGCLVLTKGKIPRTVQEIEEFMS